MTLQPQSQEQQEHGDHFDAATVAPKNFNNFNLRWDPLEAYLPPLV